MSASAVSGSSCKIFPPSPPQDRVMSLCCLMSAFGERGNETSVTVLFK